MPSVAVSAYRVVMSRLRHTPAVLLICVVAASCCAVTACGTSKSTTAATPTTGSVATATTTTGTTTQPTTSGDLTPTGASAGALGDPCALLTPADVTAAMGQHVLGIRRIAAQTDSDGQLSQQCVYLTDGTPMDVSSLAIVAGLSGGGTTPKLSGGGIGVTLEKLDKPYSKDDADPIPPSARLIPGLGDFALVIANPGGAKGVGGAGIATKGTTGVFMMDLEGRKVQQSELEALLRAIVGRL